MAQAASPEDMDLGSTPSSAAAAEPEYGAAGDGNFAAAAVAEGECAPCELLARWLLLCAVLTKQLRGTVMTSLW